MGTSSSSLARTKRRASKNSTESVGRHGESIRGSRASTGANGSSSRRGSLSPPRDHYSSRSSSSSRGVGSSGSGRAKFSLFKKAPPRHQGELPSLPGGAASVTGGGASIGPTPPTGSGSGSSEESSEALSRADSRNSASALSRSYVMSTRTSSREGRRPRTGDNGALIRSGRLSIRMSRQPSTYGELKVLVETKKLGGGVVRGLVGEKNKKEEPSFVSVNKRLMHLLFPKRRVLQSSRYAWWAGEMMIVTSNQLRSCSLFFVALMLQ